MHVVETEHWLCSLPEEWFAEQEDDVVVIIDDDEVSTIEISTLLKEKGESVTLADLRELSAELAAEGVEGSACTLGDFSGLCYRYDDDAGCWREWYVAAEQVILIITHGCEPQHKGLDDAAVDDLLSSLGLAQTALSSSKQP